MNHLKYLDILLEDTATGRWAKVKNIKIGSTAPYEIVDSHITKHLSFSDYMEDFIGKRYLFETTPLYIGLLFSPELELYFHKDWLDFEDEEGTQVNLFPSDPEPAKIHWHSAGR